MTATIIRARVIHAMTIPFTVQIAATTVTTAETALDMVMPQIDTHLHDIDTRFSPFRSDSLVGRALRGDWSALLNDREFAEIYALFSRQSDSPTAHSTRCTPVNMTRPDW